MGTVLLLAPGSESAGQLAIDRRVFLPLRRLLALLRPFSSRCGEGKSSLRRAWQSLLQRLAERRPQRLPNGLDVFDGAGHVSRVALVEHSDECWLAVRGKIGNTRPASCYALDDRVDESCPLVGDQSIRIAEQPKPRTESLWRVPPELVCEARVMQRNPLPCHERDFPEGRPGRDDVPVDDANEPTVARHDGVGSEVVVAEGGTASCWGQQWHPPCRCLVALDVDGAVVQLARCPRNVNEQRDGSHPVWPRLAGRGVTFDASQALAVADDAEWLRCQQKPLGPHMAQEATHGGTPCAGIAQPRRHPWRPDSRCRRSSVPWRPLRWFCSWLLPAAADARREEVRALAESCPVLAVRPVIRVRARTPRDQASADCPAPDSAARRDAMSSRARFLSALEVRGVRASSSFVRTLPCTTICRCMLRSIASSNGPNRWISVTSLRWHRPAALAVFLGRVALHRWARMMLKAGAVACRKPKPACRQDLASRRDALTARRDVAIARWLAERAIDLRDLPEPVTIDRRGALAAIVRARDVDIGVDIWLRQ